MKSSVYFLFFMFFTPSVFGAGFKLSSDSFKGQEFMPLEHVYDGMGCDGKNVSPALEWSGAPKGSKSFAITVFDPDAPTGSGWWHWTVANIPPKSTEIPEGASGSDKMPPGSVEGRSDYGKSGWNGPCPPKGETHNYVFTIHALKKEAIDVGADTSGAMVGYQINANTIGKAKLVIKYSR